MAVLGVMVLKILVLKVQRRDYFRLESRIPEINEFYKLARDVDLKMYLSIQHVLSYSVVARPGPV
jgi:hypothetical protein